MYADNIAWDTLDIDEVAGCYCAMCNLQVTKLDGDISNSSRTGN